MSILFTANGHPSGSESLLLASKAAAELAAAEKRARYLGPLAAGQAPWLLILALYLDQTAAPAEPMHFERIVSLIGKAAAERWLAAISHSGLLVDEVPFGRTLTAEGKQVVIDCVSD